MAQNKALSRTTLKISCACRQISGSVSVSSSALPLPFSLCHCDICRHSTGLLGVSRISLAKEPSSLEVRGNLKGYESSTYRTRFFCEQCGAFIYDKTTDRDVDGVYTGVLAGFGRLVDLKQHEFVADAIDGGLSIWLSDATAWLGQAHKSEQIQHAPKNRSVDKTKNVDSSTRLPGYCHCGGVQFQMTRPNEQSTELFSPWPDLLVPYYSGSSENLGDVKWWLREDGTKYLAGTCACNSCRLASGCDIQAWVFVPKANIMQPRGQLLDFKMGTLKQFQSTAGIYREFCSSCGATIFWHCDERPDLVDVSIGLLHSESGARAESWLDWWTQRVSFQEVAPNKALISSLSTGLRIWGEEKTTQRNEINP